MKETDNQNIQRTHKTHQQENEQSNQNVDKRLKQIPFQRDMQMENKHMKRYSTSYNIREMQIRITVRYQYIPIKTASHQNTDTMKCWEEWSKSSFHSLLVGMQNGKVTLEHNLVVSYKTKYTFICEPVIMLLGIYLKRMKIYNFCLF